VVSGRPATPLAQSASPPACYLHTADLTQQHPLKHNRRAAAIGADWTVRHAALERADVLRNAVEVQKVAQYAPTRPDHWLVPPCERPVAKLNYEITKLQ